MLRMTDVLVTMALFGIAALGSYLGSSQLNPKVIQAPSVWFEADTGRVYNNMTERGGTHYRTKVHPLFSIATAPLVYALQKVGIDKDVAVRGLIAFTAGVALVVFFCTLRILNFPIFDSTVFSVLTGVSASAMFFSTIPETFLFGGTTILAVLMFTAISERRSFSSSFYIGISALSLSMTVTNWMAGIASTLANHSPQRTVRITIDAFVVVTVLWAVQHAIFPTAEFFLFSAEERHYVFDKNAGGVLEKSTVFFLHSVVMPEFRVSENLWTDDWPSLSVQHSSINFDSPLKLAITTSWILTLAFGLLGMWKDPNHRKFKVVIAAILGGQFVLHMVYGDETFLYSLHWTPLLIMVAAFGLTLPYRKWIVALTFVSLFGVGYNNFYQFNRAASLTWSDSWSASPQLVQPTSWDYSKEGVLEEATLRNK